jgi:mRNA interferase RelE/StbE
MNPKIVWDTKAFSELQKLDGSVSRRIAKKVGELSSNPFSQDVKKIRGSSDFRLRIGDYRILFSVSPETIKILKVGHRKNIYKR